jgi:hypothetical protein
MIKKMFVVAIGLLLVGMIGCSKDEAKTAADKAKEAAHEAATETKEMASDAVQATEDAAHDAKKLMK